MKILTQDVSKDQCTLWLQLEHWDTWNNYSSIDDCTNWIAIDTSDESLLRMMIDTGLVRKDNILSIWFDFDWDHCNHVISYKKIKTIQHNQNDYTFIFLN